MAYVERLQESASSRTVASYLQFDDINARVLVHYTRSDGNICEVYDMNSWKRLFSLPTQGAEIRLSPGIITVIQDMTYVISILINCIHTGQVGREITIHTH
jgi:hypothetical protein